jgi:uncharacterized protein
MVIDVGRLPRDGETFTGEEPASVLDIAEPGMRPASPLRYELKAYMAGPELIVRGRLRVSASFACSRCGDAFPLEIEEPAFLCAREVPDKNTPVDLTPEMRESIILRFPDYPICRADCRGLCTRCGANRNRERCDCGPDASRWTALEGLRLQ